MDTEKISLVLMRISAASLALVLTACASSVFETPDPDFLGKVSIVETPRIVPGSEVKIAGRDFKPGQQITLMYGSTAMTSSPTTVGADGMFRIQVKVPAYAKIGSHSLVVNVARPAAAAVAKLKVSPDLPLSGQEYFSLKKKKLTRGLYQAAYSQKNDRLFVTAAVGRPPIAESELLKVNPCTLDVEARVTPGAAPFRAPNPPGLYAVYGVGLDDVNDTVWVTNTRQNTVAVYGQSDLKLIWQFEPGAVPHARDVIVDTYRGKAYVSTASKDIAVFDTKTLVQQENITIATRMPADSGRSAQVRAFSSMSLVLDMGNSKLYAVSLDTNEAVVIDTRTDRVEKLFALEGAQSASGVDYDPITQRLFVASQGTDNLLIVDVNTAKVVHDVSVGAGALNVAFDPVTKLAYVSNRGADTVTVVNLEGEIVANLPGGSYPNHAVIDGKGGVYAVNKARGEDDPNGDLITYITPQAWRDN